MKFFKHKETGLILEVQNSNTFNIYVREGYIEVDKDGKEIKEKVKKEEK